MQMTHLSPYAWSVRRALGNSLFHQADPDRFSGLMPVAFFFVILMSKGRSPYS